VIPECIEVKTMSCPARISLSLSCKSPSTIGAVKFFSWITHVLSFLTVSPRERERT